MLTLVRSNLCPVKLVLESLPGSVADNATAIKSLWEEVDKLVVSHSAYTSDLATL